LAELMITLAIIGLLSAGTIPLFLDARNRADAKAKVGELIGIAKECATFNAEADGNPTPVQPPTGGPIDCGGTTPTEQRLTSREWRDEMTIACLGRTIENARKVTITVTITGQFSCGIAT
jgi:type IV pilus assembly protein PilA